MKTSEQQVDTVYFSFKKIRYLSSLLFSSISLGIIMNAFMSYRTFGMGLLVYRDLLYLVIVAILAMLYFINRIKLTTALSCIAYFILGGYALILPYLFKIEGFIFYSYFLEIQFLVMLFGLILTIGVRPYHDLVLGVVNLIFSTICLVFIQEFQIEN